MVQDFTKMIESLQASSKPSSGLLDASQSPPHADDKPAQQHPMAAAPTDWFDKLRKLIDVYQYLEKRILLLFFSGVFILGALFIGLLFFLSGLRPFNAGMFFLGLGLLLLAYGAFRWTRAILRSMRTP